MFSGRCVAGKDRLLTGKAGAHAVRRGQTLRTPNRLVVSRTGKEILLKRVKYGQSQRPVSSVEFQGRFTLHVF